MSHRPKGDLFSGCAQLVEAIVGRLEVTAGDSQYIFWIRSFGFMYLRIALRMSLLHLPHCPYQQVDRDPLLYHEELSPSW